MTLRSRLYALVVVLAMALTPAIGQVDAQGREAVGSPAAFEGSADQAFRDWLAALRDEARARGISDATLDEAFRDVAPVARVVELDRRQPEFTQTFWTYMDRRVTDQRIQRGRAMLAEHRDLLEEILAKYGVPPRYIIALWGLETNYGDYSGGFRVIEALTTLAYDRRRARFFRAELLNALQILEEGHIPPVAMTGSWAGAMGQMQFIPSTFIGHAVDYSGDGRKDIWGSLPDAFASAANFLSNLGWQAGQLWGREVLLPEGFEPALASMDIKKPLHQWAAMGVRRANGMALPREALEGSIVLPQGHTGPAFLVYNNFRVIMRWNRSINYAISVGHLADRLIGLPPIASGREAEHEPLSRDTIQEIQRLLNRLGFDAGPEDGLPGPMTRAAIRAFQKKMALPPDGYPSPDLVQRLMRQAAATD